MSDEVPRARYWWQWPWGTLVPCRWRAPQGVDVHSLVPTPPKTYEQIAELYRAGRFAESQE